MSVTSCYSFQKSSIVFFGFVKIQQKKEKKREKKRRNTFPQLPFCQNIEHGICTKTRVNVKRSTLCVWLKSGDWHYLSASGPPRYKSHGYCSCIRLKKEEKIQCKRDHFMFQTMFQLMADKYTDEWQSRCCKFQQIQPNEIIGNAIPKKIFSSHSLWFR